jgi:chemotaxis protein histidine kinase CheA
MKHFIAQKAMVVTKYEKQKKMTDNNMEKFQSLMLDMRRTFLAELSDRFDIIEALILNLEVNPEDRGVFDELYRHIHSLKGSGGTYGLAIITQICHQAENILSDFIQSGFNSKAAELMLNYLDMLHRVRKRGIALDDEFSDIQLELELERSQETLAPRTLSILIAESSSMMAKLCQKTLQRESVRLSLVTDGLSALQNLVHGRFDLLVIGRELSQLNGIAVVAALRMSNNINSRVPVIMLTSNLTNIDKGSDINHVIVRDHSLAHHLIEMTLKIFPD